VIEKSCHWMKCTLVGCGLGVNVMNRIGFLYLARDI
jgi:hypothetical protein